MNTQTALMIGAVVVPLTEVVKFFLPIPQRWGILVAAFWSAVGVALWGYSQPSPFDHTQAFDYFSGFASILTTAAGVYGFVKNVTPESVTSFAKSSVVVLAAGFARGFVALLVLALFCMSGCAGFMQKAPVVVANSALAFEKSIGELQKTTKQITDAQGFNPTNQTSNLKIARDVQSRLLQANDFVKDKVVPVLEALDAAIKKGDPTQPLIVQALQLLSDASAQLSIVVAGVDVSQVTKALLDAVQASSRAVTAVIAEVAKYWPKDQPLPIAAAPVTP